MTVTVLRGDSSGGLMSSTMILAALRDSVRKLAPRAQFRNSATFGVYVASIFTTVFGIVMVFGAAQHPRRAEFVLAIAAWLWLSLLLANLADAIAVEWAKARAATLGSIGGRAQAKRLLGTDRSEYRLVDAGTLHRGDVVLVEANDIMPADGTVIDGAASVNEAAVTGESAPVLRTVGPQLSSVRCGTQVLSDWLVVRVRSREGFFDPMVSISEVVGHSRTPLEIVLSMLLVAATIAFLLGVAPLSHALGEGSGDVLALAALVALVICALPVATRACVFAVGLDSLARLRQLNVVATSGATLEAAADIDLLVLDKTGTLTRGDRRATAFLAVPGIAERELLDVAQLASLADETPEGRSIVALVTQVTDRAPRDLPLTAATFYEFSAQTRISGVDVDGRRLRKGAADAVRRFAEEAGGTWPSAASQLVERVARSGSTPLVVADGPRVLGIIELHDVVKTDIRQYCATLRRMGTKTIMMTGDNPLTAAAIAAEVGVDDFLAEATPQRKRDFIRRAQQEGHRVAMYGDGNNDAPALAQANLAVAMNTGTQLAKEAGDLVDLDSDPTKFIAIVGIGKQMLTARRSFATFGIAADLAKYFSIVPVVFAATYPTLNALNISRLTSGRSAIASTVVFNTLIIVPLLLLAMHAFKARAQSNPHLFRSRLWIYGLSGFLLSWIGIKLIDLGVAALRFM
jgi:K+-transporting ATPase ATPase B chain